MIRLFFGAGEPEWRAIPQQIPPMQIGQPISLGSDVEDLRDAFQLIATAFRGINIIAGTAASLPITVFRRRKGSDEPIADHPLAAMLHPQTGKFNEWLDAYRGHFTMFAHQQLLGNAYILKDMVRAGQPGELHTLRPDWVKPIPGRKQPVDSYEYGPYGSQVNYKPEEVIPFPLFNPFHPFIGQSPLLPARKAMMLELYMVSLNTAFFKNGATLGGVITFDRSQKQETVQAIMDRYNEIHRGSDKAYKWRGVSGAQEVKELGLNNKDLQYDQGLKWTESQVAKSLGIPKVFLSDVEGLTYANARELKGVMMETTIRPITTFRDAALNLHLASAWGKDIYVATDYSGVDALLPEMKNVSEAADKALRNGSITYGEYRQWLKTRLIPELGATDRDDLIYFDVAPSGPLAAPGDSTGGGGADPAPADSAPRRAPRAAIDPVDAFLAEHEQRRLKERREAIKDKFARRGARVDKVRPIYERALGKVFNAQETHILGNAAKLAPNDMAPLDDLLHALRGDNQAALDEALTKQIHALGHQVASDLGEDGVTFDVVHERVLRYTARESSRLIQLYDQTTAGTIREEVRKGLLKAQIEGLNIVDTAGEIMKAGIRSGFDIRRERANAIAQTETTAAYNFADLEAWRQSGVVAEKDWEDSGDEKVRPSHQSSNVPSVPVDEPFTVGNSQMMHPGDGSLGAAAEDVVECRCVMMPRLDPGLRILKARHALALLKAPASDPHRNGTGAHS